MYTKITMKSESKRKSFEINPNENEILKIKALTKFNLNFVL